MKTTSLNELVYELLELRRANVKDTDPITVRLVIDWIQSQRARLIRQKLGRSMTEIDDHLAQDLGEVNMTKVSSNDVSPAVSTGDFMWRTSIEIPRTIASRDGKGTFLRIGPANKLKERYDIVHYSRIGNLGFGKFNKNNVFAFILGDYVYLHSKTGHHFTVKNINIKGVFQDPTAAALIQDATWDYDDDYPINKSIIDDLKMLILKEKFSVNLVQSEDKTDNLEDDPSGNAVQKGKA